MSRGWNENTFFRHGSTVCQNSPQKIEFRIYKKFISEKTRIRVYNFNSDNTNNAGDDYWIGTRSPCFPEKTFEGVQNLTLNYQYSKMLCIFNNYICCFSSGIHNWNSGCSLLEQRMSINGSFSRQLVNYFIN